jgi:outer membrane protein
MFYNIKTKYAIFGLLMFAQNIINAQDKYNFTLKQAVEYGLSHVSSVRNASLDEQIAREKVNEIKSIGYPQANASYGFNAFAVIPYQYISNFSKASISAQNQLNGLLNAYGNNLNQINGSSAPQYPTNLPTNIAADDYIKLQFTQRYSSTLQASVSQLIFDGTYLMGLKAAKEYQKISQYQTEKTEKDVEDAIIKAYNLALITQENIKLIDNNILFLEKVYKDTKAVYENGFAEKLDVDRLSLRLSNLNTQKINLNKTYEIVLKALKMQMNMPVENELQLADDLTKLDTETSALINENNIMPNAENRVEMKTLKHALYMQDLDMKRHKVGRYPTLVGFFNFQYASNRDRFSFYDFTNVPINEKYVPSALFGIQAKYTIFDGFKNKAQMAQIKIEKEKINNTISTFKNAVALETYAAKNKLENAKAMLIEQKKNVSLAEEIFNITSIKFKEGVGSTLELTQADTELKTAQINYLNALYDVVLAKYELKKSMGL